MARSINKKLETAEITFALEALQLLKTVDLTYPENPNLADELRQELLERLTVKEKPNA